MSQLTPYYTVPTFNSSEMMGFKKKRKEIKNENIVGKGKNAGNQHFLLFPQCFLPFPKQISIFHFVVCKCFQFGPVKVLFGKGLKPLPHNSLF